jgi:hypothetical protein
MKLKINTALLAALLIFAQSCQKTENLVTSLSAEQTLLNKFLTVQNAKEGSVYITSRTQNFKNDVSYRVEAGLQNSVYKTISINDLALELRDPAERLINQYQLNERVPKTDIANLFGKDLLVSLNKTDVNLRDGSTNIYNPSPLIMNGGPRNTQFSWNAGNNGDVYILISFRPDAILNEAFVNYQKVERFIETNDDGYHALTDSDFAGIPVGAVLDMAVVRGRVILAAGSSSGNGGVSIQAISTCSIIGYYGGSGSGGGSGGSGSGSGGSGPILHLP